MVDTRRRRVIAFRHCDRRYPFLWAGAAQPPARWHGGDDGPVQYFADTPDGAWAEFLSHEDIVDADDLPGVRRTIWAADLDDVADLPRPRLDDATLTGGVESYAAGRAEARRLRAAGEAGLRTPSAALLGGAAAGERVVDGGLVDGPPRDGETIVLFGVRSDLGGWRAATGAPEPRLLGLVRAQS